MKSIDLEVYARTVCTTLGFILVFRRVLYNSVECKGAKQNKNSQNFQILSFELSISGLCCFVQTTVDHFLFLSAAVLPDQLCTKNTLKSQIY